MTSRRAHAHVYNCTKETGVIDDCSSACLNDFWTKTVCTMNIGMGENDRERSPQKRNVIMIIYNIFFSVTT